MKIFRNTVLALLICSCSSEDVHDQTLTGFFEKHENVRVFYLYESTLRMLNKAFDGTFQDSFRDVDNARFGVVLGDEAQQINQELPELNKQLLAQGDYELLMSFKDKGFTTTAYMKEGDNQGFFIYAVGRDMTFLIELTGKINLKDIQNITTMDFPEMINFFDLALPEAESDSLKLKEDI